VENALPPCAGPDRGGFAEKNAKGAKVVAASRRRRSGSGTSTALPPVVAFFAAWCATFFVDNTSPGCEATPEQGPKKIPTNPEGVEQAVVRRIADHSRDIVHRRRIGIERATDPMPMPMPKGGQV